MKVLINGRSVTLASDPTIELITEDKWELRGDATIEHRMTELDQVGPEGRWRWRVEDDEWLLQRATFKRISSLLTNEEREDAYWSTFDTLMRLNSAGVTVELDQDKQIDLLEELYVQVKQTREFLEAVLS